MLCRFGTVFMAALPISYPFKAGVWYICHATNTKEVDYFVTKMYSLLSISFYVELLLSWKSNDNVWINTYIEKLKISDISIFQLV